MPGVALARTLGRGFPLYRCSHPAVTASACAHHRAAIVIFRRPGGGVPMARKLDQSRKLQKRAEMLIPGGVNSPVRAFGAVGGDPPFVVRGSGSHIWDADDNEY